MQARQILVIIVIMVVGTGIYLSACRDHRVAKPPSNAANPRSNEGVDTIDQTPSTVDVDQTSEPVEQWRTRAIDLAKSHLEAVHGKPVDATFSAKQLADGYIVLVQYITGRDKSGQPIYIPGGHCGVQISNDWKVTEVLPGA